MDTLRRDLAYALRTLLRKPGFAAIAVATLALGIAANTAIFSLVNGVLLRPLPYPHAERLLNLWTIYAESHGQHDIFSPGNFLDLQAHSRTLEALGAYTDFSFTLSGAGQPEFFPGIKMTASTAQVLGIAPQLGRWFTAAEDSDNQPVMVLSNALWRNRLGADPHILGRALQLNGRAYTVVGVLPPAIGYPSLLTQIYAPISFTPEDRASRGSIFLNAIARLKPGVSPTQARAELATLAAQMAKAYPDVDSKLLMGADSLQDSLVGNVRDMLIVLWAAVAFMLAVGCANVANLLLTRAAARHREFALRRSLGATNARLIRQLLTESLVLALAGGVAGLALAALAVPAMASQLPASFPRVRDIAVDGQVLWFTFAISVLTGVLFGLAPALSSARRNLAQALREGGDRGGTGAHQRIGRLLVVAEIAAVLVLMVGAGLVLRSLVRLSSVDPGFQARGRGGLADLPASLALSRRQRPTRLLQRCPGPGTQPSRRAERRPRATHALRAAGPGERRRLRHRRAAGSHSGADAASPGDPRQSGLLRHHENPPEARPCLHPARFRRRPARLGHLRNPGSPLFPRAGRGETSACCLAVAGWRWKSSEWPAT